MLQTALDELKLIWGKLPSFLSSLFVAIVIVVVGIVLLRLGRRLSKKAYINYSVRRGLNVRGETMQNLFLSLFNIVMYFLIIMASLSVLGVDVKSLLTVAGFSGFALVFACQTLLKDVISGMFLWIEGSCNVGDVVTIAGQKVKAEVCLS